MLGNILLQRYEIVKHLGKGGFGDTYLANDLALPDCPPCVVKHLKPKDVDPSGLEIAQRLFESEAKILYQLGKECGCIPELFAKFQENGEFYLVQEFIDGHTLSQEILPKKQWQESEVIRLLRDILTVLAIVHEHNAIHRDLKPQNIMRRHSDGKIVLIDFGSVKQIATLTGRGKQTQYSVAVGTLGYMPSEQAAGMPKLCSDVYAVGMIGIQALTGIHPDARRSSWGFVEDPDTGNLIWQHHAQVSSELAAILDKMICYHFADRYRSAVEVLQDLMGATTLAVEKTGFVAARPTRRLTAGKKGQIPWRTSLGAGVAASIATTGVLYALSPAPTTSPVVTSPAVVPQATKTEPPKLKSSPVAAPPTPSPKPVAITTPLSPQPPAPNPLTRSANEAIPRSPQPLTPITQPITPVSPQSPRIASPAPLPKRSPQSSSPIAKPIPVIPVEPLPVAIIAPPPPPAPSRKREDRSEKVREDKEEKKPKKDKFDEDSNSGKSRGHGRGKKKK
jgi:serine/threonine protein kinase